MDSEKDYCTIQGRAPSAGEVGIRSAWDGRRCGVATRLLSLAYGH